MDFKRINQLRKAFLLLLAVCSFMFSIAQEKNILHPDNREKIKWQSIELIISKSSIDSILNYVLWDENDKYLNDQKIRLEDCHFTDLNTDGKVDMIVYYFNGVGNTLSIYENTGKNLIPQFRKNGELIKMNDILGATIEIHLISYHTSGYPLIATYSNLRFQRNKPLNPIEISTVVFGDHNDLPSNFNKRIVISIGNTRYHLRSSPNIERDNIIADFTSGDKGIVLSSETDETGREWFFCLMLNNIVKDISFYPHSDHYEISDQMYLGWLSSRYVEIE